MKNWLNTKGELLAILVSWGLGAFTLPLAVAWLQNGRHFDTWAARVVLADGGADARIVAFVTWARTLTYLEGVAFAGVVLGAAGLVVVALARLADCLDDRLPGDVS